MSNSGYEVDVSIPSIFRTGPHKTSPFAPGHVEGWAMVCIAGRREWKKVWMVVGRGDERRLRRTLSRKHRHGPKRSNESVASQEPSATAPLVKLCASPDAKDKASPLLTLSNITQAFAVYNERPELVDSGTGMTIEGLIGEEPLAQTMKGREGWLMVIPEVTEKLSRNELIVMWLMGTFLFAHREARPAYRCRHT